MKRWFGFLIFIGLLLALSIPTPMAAQETIYYPTTEWRTSTPEAQGMDSQELADLLGRITNGGVKIHSLLVIRHGDVVLDASVFPFKTTEPHALFSVTKSFVATLVGIAIDQGHIKGVDQSIWDFFDPAATANMDERKQAITVRDLLTQTSGLGLTGAEDLQIYQLTASDPSWVQFALDQPMAHEPGTVFNYLDANAHLLSAIVQQATGMTTLEFAQRNLFGPLGITDVTWMADPQGVYTGGDQLFMSPYSIAKLGYLYLHNGVWDAQQIVAAGWITAATSTYTPGDYWDGYGYLWRNGKFVSRGAQHQGYLALGLSGQELWVIPDLDLVVVLTGDSGYLGLSLLVPQIVTAVQSDMALPDSPDAQTGLESMVEALAHPSAVTVSPLSESAQRVSGHVYTFTDNALGWQSIELDFGEQEAQLRLEVNDTYLELPVGLDGVARLSSVGMPINPVWRPLPDIPLALDGAWRNDRTFVINMRDIRGMEDGQTSFNFNTATGSLSIMNSSFVTQQTVAFRNTTS